MRWSCGPPGGGLRGVGVAAAPARRVWVVPGRVRLDDVGTPTGDTVPALARFPGLLSPGVGGGDESIRLGTPR